MTQLVAMLDDLDTALTPDEVLKIESQLFGSDSKIQRELDQIRLELECNNISYSLTPAI